jgi:hypothetical protein
MNLLPRCSVERASAISRSSIINMDVLCVLCSAPFAFNPDIRLADADRTEFMVSASCI